MKWTPRGRSKNLEDRRSQGAPRGRMRIPFPTGGGGRGPKLSITGILLMLGLAWLLGINPLSLLGAVAGGGGGGTVQVPTGAGVPGAAAPPAATSAAEERQVEFVSFVLDDAQAVWGRLVQGYPEAKLVVYRGGTRTACGLGQAAMGPFYCPADQKVYIDLSFYDELQRRFGAPGDMAQAYVLAHEIGHHVQKVTGTEAEMRRAQQRDPARANDYSIKLELQADCYAGVWAHSTNERQLLEAGDVEEAMRAAAAVGDDQIQKMSTGRVAPEQWTHGSSEQRMKWFDKGFASGDPRDCDTFSGGV